MLHVCLDQKQSRSVWFRTVVSAAFVQMKTGPFAEHSNQLWNISAVPNWSKVNQGLIRMYKAEVSNAQAQNYTWVPAASHKAFQKKLQTLANQTQSNAVLPTFTASCARELCTRAVHESCARELCTRAVHESCARELCTTHIPGASLSEALPLQVLNI